MKLPNWFRVLWWSLLLAGVTFFLASRYAELISGNAVPADIIIFLVWIALWLLPVVSEMNIFGIQIKKEVEAIRKDMNEKIDTLRADIRNQVDIRTQVNPQFTIPIPAPDAQLPRIEEQVRRAVEAAMRAHGLPLPEGRQTADLSVSEVENYLFGVRLNIERELRRIYRSRFPGDTSGRYSSVIAISRVLANGEVIDPELGNAIREVYRACSPAVHGEDISEVQVSFVREVAPELVTTLRAIQ
jgi:hypothetical protein